VQSGQALTLTATVTHLSGIADPTTGSVLFFDNGAKITTCSGSNLDGSVTLTGSGLNANQALCSLSSGLSPAGTHPLTAIYNPVTPVAGSSAPFGSSLSAVQNLAVAQSTGTTLTTAATVASGVTLTATVTPVGGTVNPTGTVTFTDGTGAAVSCSNSTTTPPDQVAVAAGSGNTGTASCATDFSSTTGIGSKLALKASYTPADATVFGASNTDPMVTGSSTALTNPGPVPNGQAVTLTATVIHQSGVADPTTGSVLFFDNGTKITTCSGSNLDGSVTLTGSGLNANQALCSLSSGLSPAGTHPLTAIYNPATPVAGSSAAFGSSLSAVQNLVVSQSTGTALTTSATDASGVTLTATVTPNAGTANPTGTVTFTDGTGAAISCSNSTTTPPDQVAVAAGSGNTGTASCATDFSSAGIGGKLALEASYTPTDATVFGASSTNPTVPGTSTNLTLLNSSPVTLTATVTHLSGIADPTTGSVLFFDNGAKITTCTGSNLDGSVTLTGSGLNANQAVCNLAAAFAAGHSLTAVYNPIAPSAGSSAAFGSSLSSSVTS
jgi:hypothetical protein